MRVVATDVVAAAATHVVGANDNVAAAAIVAATDDVAHAAAAVVCAVVEDEVLCGQRRNAHQRPKPLHLTNHLPLVQQYLTNLATAANF
jgi:hypothetical protein